MNNSAYKRALEEFDKGLYCAESVLKVIAEEQGISSELIPMIATGLCSGMARTCGMCGALSGGILALNIVYGRKSKDESVEKNYMTVQKLISDFKKEFGTANCQELIGCDIGTPEGQETFSSKELILHCREFTGKAAAFVSNIIKENPVTT
jgi:C_GCAxxG_C_C family probable redox protein